MPSGIEYGADLIAAEVVDMPAQNPPARWRWGTVESVGAGVMQVNIGGASVPGIRCAEHVMGAKVGDRVRVAYYGPDAIVDAIRAAGGSESHSPLAFRECATESTSISSGSCVEVSATIPTVEGYTRRGIIQTWTTGTGNTIVGSQSCSGSKAYAKVRSNNASQVVVHFYVLYEYTG